MPVWKQYNNTFIDINYDKLVSMLFIVLTHVALLPFADESISKHNFQMLQSFTFSSNLDKVTVENYHLGLMTIRFQNSMVVVDRCMSLQL